MAVAFDTATAAQAAASAFTNSPHTWTHVNSGNCIIIGFVNSNGVTTNIVSAVTYGGVSIPLLKWQGSSSGGGFGLWGLAGATVPTGSNTVSVTFTIANDAIAGSISLKNVSSLGTPVSAATTTNGSSFSISVPGTTTGGMIVVGSSFGGANGGGTFSGTNSVTVGWQDVVSNSGPADNGVQGYVASTGGGASQTVGFSSSASGSDQWAMVAVEALPPAGPTVPVVRFSHLVSAIPF